MIVPEYDTTPLTESYLGTFEKGQQLVGDLQEFRLSPNARSQEWLAAEYADICGSLYTVGGVTSSVLA